MSGYLIDTSVFIGAERGLSVGPPPDGEARISVVTVTELSLGVRRAGDAELRRLREHTLSRARSFIALPYDEPVAELVAELVDRLRSAGRRASLMDTIIAATAVTRGLDVWTADRDFLALADLEPRLEVSMATSG